MEAELEVAPSQESCSFLLVPLVNGRRTKSLHLEGSKQYEKHSFLARNNQLNAALGVSIQATFPRPTSHSTSCPPIYSVKSLGLSGPQVGTWGVADGFLQIADVEIL